MSYEQAPATKLLATHCACCSRSLLDASSVERGIGPDCAKKYGYADAQREADWSAALAALGSASVPVGLNDFWGIDAKKVCNLLVWQIAADKQNKFVSNWILTINSLGFCILAEKLAIATGGVLVTESGNALVVETPYSDEWNFMVRSVRGQKFDRDLKARIIPISEKKSLWYALCEAFAGKLCVGKNGIRLIKR